MTTAVEIADVDLSGWPFGARMFLRDNDNQHFIVDSDQAVYPTDGPYTFIRRVTNVFYCNESGQVLTDMTPEHVFDPGTTAEQVIELLGYTL